MGKDSGGIINVYKPAGMTSFAVVSRIRRLTGVKKVGHCGTLDPFAQGVLPICIGRATAAVNYMDGYDKLYRVGMIFGKQTDTQDCTGTVIKENEPTEAELYELKKNGFEPLRKAIKALTGKHEQLPPMYSAIKMNGRHLYEYARKGMEIDRMTREITIYDAELVEAAADGNFCATVDIHCSKGTYIRTICDDLGKALSYGAYADTLIRKACGPFTIENSISIRELEELLSGNAIDPLEFLSEKNIMIPTEFALSSMEKIHLTKEQSLSIIQGQKIFVAGIRQNGKPMATFCCDGRFIGITSASGNVGQETTLSAERIFVDVANYR